MRKRSPAIQALAFIKIFFLAVTFVGCSRTLQHSPLGEVDRLIKKEKYRVALSAIEEALHQEVYSESFEDLAERGLLLTREHSKDFNRELWFLEFLINNSENQEKKVVWLKRKIEILFQIQNRYQQVIPEIQRLIFIEKNIERTISFRIQLAKSYFFLSQFDDALTESKNTLQLNLSKEDRFTLLLLQANTLLGQQRTTESIDILYSLIKEFPTESLSENVHFNLTQALEENFRTQEAIQVLEQVKPVHRVPEFVQLRIDRLKVKNKNVPGAGGLRK